MADQVLIFADTERSPELRHELPVAIGDAFLYAENNGSRYVLTNVLEIEKMKKLGVETRMPDDYGIDELLKSGKKPREIRNELLLRACRDLGITDAAVPFWFPVDLADFLRGNGIELRADEELFDERRRSKNEAEIAGMRRAQKAAEAGMQVAADMLRASEPGDGGLVLEGEPLTVERMKVVMSQAFMDHGAASDDFIVAWGEQGARGHDMGSGQIQPNSPVVIDLFPKDKESACYADMTRTFVVGEPDEEIVEWHRLVKEAVDRTIEPIKPGVTGRELFDIACDIFEEAGPEDPADEGARQAAGRGVLPQPRARRGPRGARGVRTSGCSVTSRSSPATSSRSSPACTGRATAASGSRISSSSPRTATRT